jgi:SagB-type dehydrogenase family enzyme
VSTDSASPVARRFHDATTHTPHSVRASGHRLDWDIKPFPFKVYTAAPTVALPRTFDPVTTDTLASIAGTGMPQGVPLDLQRLAALLYLSAGVTKKKVYPGGGEVLFRAAASTGALYQTEVYVAAGEVEGLAPGLYHFCPGDFMLRQLRAGDVRGALAQAAADPELGRRAAIGVLTAIYWRNTWKYQARGFRHLFWDSGTMLANVLASGNALGLAPALVTGFVDDDVNRIVGIDVNLDGPWPSNDGAREAALELVGLGPLGTAAAEPGPLPAITLETLPLSSTAVDYPLLREMMEASHLTSVEEVRAWRRAAPLPARSSGGTRVPLPAPRAAAGWSLSETIQRRGSTRQFSHAPIQPVELATALWAATRPIPADVPLGLVDLFLIVNAVEGLAPGAYVYRPAPHALELIRAGGLRDLAGYLALEQPIAGDAAAVIFFLAPLDEVLARWGDRGYRLVNLEAGIAGGRAYLAAYGLGFGASGLTFYDQLVVEAFAPASAGMDAIFVTALGRSVREPRAPVIDRISR